MKKSKTFKEGGVPKKDIELVEILQASCARGDDPLRTLMAHTLQRVLEEEITAFLNAETYERTDKRKGYRNGYKPQKLKTRVGRIELMVPKDREGRFQPWLLKRTKNGWLEDT